MHDFERHKSFSALLETRRRKLEVKGWKSAKLITKPIAGGKGYSGPILID